MKRLEWYIARRYLASRKKGRFLSLITVIAVGGVCLGVTALITVIAVMTGLQRDLQSKILGSNPHVYVFDHGGALRLGNWSDVLPRVRRVPGVIAAEPYVSTNVAITKDATWVQPGVLWGLDPTIPDQPLTVIERDLRAGDLTFGPTPGGKPGAILGRGLAQRLNVLPGDTIIVAAFENIKQDAFGGFTPVTFQFEVTGTFKTGMYEYDNNNIYVELEPAQALLGFPPDTVTGLAVNVADPWTAREVGSTIFFDLGQRYWIQDWMDLNMSLFSALKLEKLAMAVILFMIVLVAAFNIVSTLIMVVADKTREIGILKSMGLTRSAVLRVFMLQGIAIGLIGTALGVAGGLGLVALIDRYELIKLPGDVYFIETLPVALDPIDFTLIILASVAIAFVATIYPARQAARLLPVEAIRHD